MRLTRHSRAAAALVLGFAIAGCGESTNPRRGGLPSDGAALLENFSSRQVFPASNWWNIDVSSAPVDPRSQAIIDWISGRTAQNPTATRRLHPDFGPPPYGIPYVGVGDRQPLVPVDFSPYGSESDAGAPGQLPGYPIPPEARTRANYIEGAVPGGGSAGDRHLILIDRERWILYETWATQWNAATGRWQAGSGAVFNLATNARRPEGWTSADAAGLAIFPGLVRWDEAAATEPITHAFRVTTRATNGYVWPASHAAGSTAGAPPMGTRLRLKASVDISSYAPEIRKILQAMKTYGLIVADNGSDMYVTGTMDSRWNNDALNPAFRALTADDFEVIVLGWEGLRTRGSGRGARASGTATAFRGTTGTTQRGLRGNARTTARAATRGALSRMAPSTFRSSSRRPEKDLGYTPGTPRSEEAGALSK